MVWRAHSGVKTVFLNGGSAHRLVLPAIGDRGLLRRRSRHSFGGCKLDAEARACVCRHKVCDALAAAVPDGDADAILPWSLAA